MNDDLILVECYISRISTYSYVTPNGRKNIQRLNLFRAGHFGLTIESCERLKSEVGNDRL